MHTRRSLLGLLVLAGVAGLALIAVRERPAPRRSVRSSAPDPAEAEAPREVTAGEGAADVADFGEGTVWGTVEAPAGIDVTETRIVVFMYMGVVLSSNTAIKDFRAALEVGRDGTFRRDGLPLGKYRLRARCPPCAPCVMQFELRSGRATGPLRVVLGGPGSLLIRCVGPDGRGLGGEHFALHRAGHFSHPEYRLEPAVAETAAGFTDAEGEIRFANLDPGDYTLTRRGSVIEQRIATVRADGETVVLFDVGGSLFGRLLGHDGQPIPEAKLLLRTSGGWIYETRADEGGAFAVRGIAAGEYGVTACVKGLGTIPLAGTLVVEDGRTHEREFRLPSIRLTGSVVHAESGAPFTSRRVWVKASATPDPLTYPWIHLSFDASARTTTDGRFELAGLYPGRYTVEAYPKPRDDAYEERASVVVTVTPTPATQELVLRIPRTAKTARLRLTVRDRHGDPAENLLFSIDGRTRVLFQRGILRTGDANVVAAGVYDILLVPGAHRIRAHTQPTGEPGRRSCYYEDLDIELEPGRTVERTITLGKLLENR